MIFDWVKKLNSYLVFSIIIAGITTFLIFSSSSTILSFSSRMVRLFSNGQELISQ